MASWARLLSSIDVDAHADYLNLVRADLGGFVEQSALVTRSLTEQTRELLAASADDSTVTRILTDLSAAHVPHRATTMLNLMSFVDSLTRSVPIGREIASELRTLEAQLSQRTYALESAQSEYDRVAYLEDVPLLDWAERQLRQSVEDAYNSRADAERQLRAVEGQIAAKGDEWRQRLRHQLSDLADPAPRTGHNAWRDEKKDITGYRDGHYRPPWVTRPDGSTSIDIDDVIQSPLGDCYFAAAIAALIGTKGGIEYLKSLIVDKGDGTFIVTFPGVDPIIVDGDMYVDSNGDLIGVRPDGDYWFVILEKAYAQYKGGYDKLNEGGEAKDVLALLGLPSASESVSKMSDGELSARLSLINSGHAVTVAGYMHDIYPDWKEDPKNPDRHEFSVVGYKPGPPPMVIVRTPWGDHGGFTPANGEGSDPDGFAKGEIQMTLDEFRRMFDRVSNTSDPIPTSS